MGPVSLQSSCLNIKYYHSTLKYLSFKVLHDNTNQNHDFTHFRGTPILGGSKKGVRGVKKIGPQHFRVLYTLRVLQTKNQKMNPKIERRVVFLTLRHALGPPIGSSSVFLFGSLPFEVGLCLENGPKIRSETAVGNR